MAKETTVVPDGDIVTSSVPPGLQQLLQGIKSNKSLNQIVPTGPTAEELKLESRRILGRAQDALSFGEAFGIVGAPMLLILIVCVAWTSWLVFLALVPNKAANMLMDTTSYDNGQFWLFNDANPQIILAGAVGLMIVDICYLLVTLRMLFWRDKLFGSAYQSQPAINIDSSYSWMRSSGPIFKRLYRLWNEFTAFEGKNRKKWNALLKLFDLAMEMAVLRQLLQS